MVDVEGFLPLAFRFISHAGIQMGLDQSASRAVESQTFFLSPTVLSSFHSPADSVKSPPGPTPANENGSLSTRLSNRVS